jgi:hypothetical protein
MNKPNLLIGAISANYSPSDIERWVTTSEWEDCERVLLVYNIVSQDNPLLTYLKQHNVTVLQPNFDFWGNEISTFNHHTGVCNLENSYDLIHNIRFFHIWNYLQSESYEKVLITDVRDVYFNYNPFTRIPSDKLIATSEELCYKDHNWNHTHLHYNLGVMGISTLSDELIYNVGVFGGSAELVRQIAADIYLLSVGKHKVADQTSFNYLIQTRYKHTTEFSRLEDKFAVHLHVVNEGLVKFNYKEAKEYAVIHQYDRFNNWETLQNG